MYALLSRMWLQEVDAEFVGQLQGPFGDAFRSAGGWVPSDDDIDEMAAEYCRLFIGPKNHLPPFQSVWAQGTLQSEISNSVQSFADAVRYQPTSQASMPDHLGTQLDIMSHALQLSAEDPENGELEELSEEFYRRHLTWPFKLFSTAKERSEHAFYSSMVEMTDSFLRSFAPGT